MRPAISLRQLHYLVAVADSKSFSSAALETHVAQPALSRQIALLEELVGSRLLRRSRKGVTLTDGGVRLYNLARSMLERLDGVEAELRSSEQRPAGVVTVALPPSVASMLVPALVRELAHRHPAIVLRVEDGPGLENGYGLAAEQVDFAIVPGAEALVDVEYEVLLRESLLLVERREPARRPPATIAFARAARLPLALPPRTSHTRRVVDEAAHAARIALNVAYEQRSPATIMGLVRDGLAATITSSLALEQLWKPGSVRARRIVSPEVTRTISLARPAGRALGFAARAVYDIARELALDAVRQGGWRGKVIA
jgi:LysR family nitrogen assimilation transcriptional regulator